MSVVDFNRNCSTCGASPGEHCRTRTGKLYERGHAERQVKARDPMLDWHERERLRDEATKPKGPPPFMMEIRTVVGGTVQRFLPAPDRLGRYRKLRAA